MDKILFVIGTADTKLDELTWIKSCLQAARVNCQIIDVSTKKFHQWQNHPFIDISSTEIAEYHPVGEKTVFVANRSRSIAAMADSLTLYLESHISVIGGIIGIGGSCGTALISQAMRALPIGLPKLLVSTMASGNVAEYVGGVDIAMLYSLTDLNGLNFLSRTILSNAANMLAGSVSFTQKILSTNKPALALTMFGVTTPCINQLLDRLKQQYEPLVFHATGQGGTTMEKLISDGQIIAVLDITLTEVADLLFGGVLACQTTRLDCIAKTQTPWIGSAGAVDMVNFASLASIPSRYRHRRFVEHNAHVNLMRTTPEENHQIGVWIGHKLNLCYGPIRFIIPEGGFSALDAIGQPFYNPLATQAFSQGLHTTVQQTPQRQIICTPHHINSPEFAALVLQQFDLLHLPTTPFTL